MTYTNCDLCLKHYTIHDENANGICYDCDVDATYFIVRRFHEGLRGGKVIKRGLTLRQAMAHCKDPETSSSTATSPTAVALTKKYGPWFDGYCKER